MGDDNKLGGKVGLDTTDFKTAISELNRQIRVVESGFRAAAAGLGEWGTSASGLETRIGALNSEIDLQGRKVTALRGEYERVRAEKGENSRAAQELEIKLNKETETLGKMENELSTTQGSLNSMGEASDSAGDEVEDTGEKTEESGKKAEGAGLQFSGFGAVMDGLKTTVKAGVAAVIGLSAALIGVGAAVTGLVVNTAATADELDEMSLVTGISVRRLQELAYVGNQVGTSTETITGAMTRLVRSMSTATDQQATFGQAQAEAIAAGEEFDGNLGDVAAAFETLGVAVTDPSGALRDNEAVFADALTALGNVKNEAERDALAMTLFGKSAQELNPLVKAGADEIARLSEEANTVGAVMGTDNVTALAAFNDKLGSLKMGLQGTLGELAGAFLPGFQGLADQAGTYMSAFGSIVRGSGGDLGTMGEHLGNLIGVIAGDLAEQAPAMLEAGLALIQSLITSLVALLPTLMPLALQIITSLVGFLVLNLPTLISAGITILMALINGIIPMLPMLLMAAIQMIMTLASGLLAALPEMIPVIMGIIPMLIDILVTNLPSLITMGINLLVALITGIAEALPEIIPAVIGIIPTIIATLIENLPLLVGAALTLILALATGLVDALPDLVASIPTLIMGLVDAIVLALPQIGAAALTLITTLATGLVDNLPALGETAGDIITAVVDGIVALATTIWQVGSDILTGIWQGISDNIEVFKQKVLEFFQGIIDSIAALLGIASPSTVFAEMGANMALGLGVGFTRAFDGIESRIMSAVDGLAGMTVGAPSLTPNDNSSDGRGGRDITITVNITGGTGQEREAAQAGVLAAARRVGWA